MSDQMVRFLLDLSKDPLAMEEFSSDPDGFLSRFSLSEEEKRLLRSGDTEAIYGSLKLAGMQYAMAQGNTPKPLPPPPPPPKPPKPAPPPGPNPGKPAKADGTRL